LIISFKSSTSDDIKARAGAGGSPEGILP
jgi:hypothetical protein